MEKKKKKKYCTHVTRNTEGKDKKKTHTSRSYC